MFGLMRNFYNYCKHRKERVVTVALLGVDNAGKSTILYRLKGEIQEFVAPTIGFSSEIIKQGRLTLKVFDLGGGANIRGIWPRYYAELHGAVFVIDSSDRTRLHVAREVLHEVLDHGRFANKPLLILANKQDKEESMTSEEITSNLALEKFKGLQYHVITCTALLLEVTSPPDPKIANGLKWLTNTIEGVYGGLQKRILKDSEEQKEEERIEREEKRKRVEARKRERELERELAEKEKEMQTMGPNKTENNEKITIITEGGTKNGNDDVITGDKSARTPRASTPRKFGNNSVAPLTDIVDKGRDGEELHSARKSMQKTPRNVMYSITAANDATAPQIVDSHTTQSKTPRAHVQ